MSARMPLIRFSIEEYLEMEKASPVRHEYLAGHIYAMAGTSKPHNQIALNCATRLKTHLRGGECRTYMSDVKLYVKAVDTFYYPDVFVACDPNDKEKYFVTRPRLIIEVLSDSTAAIDRREKWQVYQNIESLHEYILISQDERRIELYRRDRNGNWWVEILAADRTLQLESVNLELTMDEIYEEVEGV